MARVAKNNIYTEFQFAWWIFILIPIWLTLAIPYFSVGSGMTLNTLLIGSVIFLAVGLLFYGMRTVVNETKIKIIFGIGLIRITVKLENVNRLKPLKTNGITAGVSE